MRVSACMLLAVCFAAGPAWAEVTVDAPPSLASYAERLGNLDLAALERDLQQAGLQMPDRAHVTLVEDADPRAREIPRWVVGLAFGDEDIVIFPQRVLPYPHDSVESVLRHEITHLALWRQAGGEPLPRWFHEGVAMSVDRDWGIGGQLRLLVEMAASPGTGDLTRLFSAGSQPQSALAYGLSAALVADVQRRHGSDVPGRIAARVAAGVPFPRAFTDETGETPDDAAARAWRVYRRWTSWVPALTSGTAVWTAIMAIAAGAYIAVRRRRARRRRQWDAEEAAAQAEAEAGEDPYAE